MNCKTYQRKDGKRLRTEGRIVAKSRAGRPKYAGKNQAGQPAAEGEQIKDQQVWQLSSVGP